MQRYFLVHDDHLPTIKENFGELHYVDLGSHGTAGAGWNLLCLAQEHHQPKPEWQALPKLYDAKTTLAQSPIDHALLANLGVTGEETAMEAIEKFGAVHPLMKP